MTAPRKYTDEQIVTILQEHQGRVMAKEIIRRHGSRWTLSLRSVVPVWLVWHQQRRCGYYVVNSIVVSRTL